MGTLMVQELQTMMRSPAAASLDFASFLKALFEPVTWGDAWTVLLQLTKNGCAQVVPLHIDGADVLASVMLLGVGQHTYVVHVATVDHMVALKFIAPTCPSEEYGFVYDEMMLEARILSEIERQCWNLDCREHIGAYFAGPTFAYTASAHFMLVLESYLQYHELYKLFIGVLTNQLLDDNWLECMRAALFQIVFTLAQLQLVFPGFRHNDLKDNNVLVVMLAEAERFSHTYVLGGGGVGPKRFRLERAPVDIKIVDFATAHAHVPALSNPHVLEDVFAPQGITKFFCPLYDLHFLVYCFFMRAYSFPPCAVLTTVTRFFYDVIPPKYFLSERLTDGSRLTLAAQHELVADATLAYRSPVEVLDHPFFDRFVLRESAAEGAPHALQGVEEDVVMECMEAWEEVGLEVEV